MVFPVVKCGCESWTVKKAEHWRTIAFKLWGWGWRRLLRIPWTARRSNQSILREINNEYSSERLMLKLKLLIWSPDVNNQLIGKDLDAGKEPKQKEKSVSEDEMAGWHYRCNGHELGQTPGDGEGQEGLACCSPWGCKESDKIGQLTNNNKYIYTYIHVCVLVSMWRLREHLVGGNEYLYNHYGKHNGGSFKN